MPHSSLWFGLVAVVAGGLLSLSTVAVAAQPVCGLACAPSSAPATLTAIPATTSTPALDATPSDIATPTSAQQTRDAIAVVAQKVSLVTQDSSLSQDAKAQQINALAMQFNQLVNQLQQSECGLACPQTPASSSIPPTPVPSAAGMPTPTSAQQQTRDEIVAVTQQVSQVTRDSSLSQDAKAQEIDALVGQINQLVSQLQPTSPTTALTPAAPAPVPMNPANVSSPVPTSAPTPSSAQQTRDQIAVVVQQVSQVTQDASLSQDAKAQQINALAVQFNQLVNQLQQQGP